MNKFDEILRRDDVWFIIAMAVAFAFFFAVFIGVFIVFLGGDADAMHVGLRADVLYKLALIGAGFVTFCTVVWRGLLATQQVEAQRQQLQKLTEQIIATDENNLALRLQKGAELLSDPSKRSHVAAGLVSLQAIATAPNSSFAIEAVNLIADYIEERGRTSHVDASVKLAIEKLERVWRKTGLVAERDLEFEPEPTDVGPKRTYWRIVYGARSVFYNEGNIRAQKISIESNAKIYFADVSFSSCYVDVSKAFEECTFTSCVITGVEEFGKHIFQKCDFSGALIREIGTTDLRHTGCWYDRTNPPKLLKGGEIDWSQRLIEGSQSTRRRQF